MKGAYVAGDLTGLLQTYLDNENLDASEIRQVLATYPANSRMPMTLWWELLEKIQAIEKRPALGLRIGSCVRPQHSGVLGYLIMYCQTLGEALIRFKRYQSLLHNFSEVQLATTSTSLTMSWDVKQGHSTQLSDEVFLSALMTFVREITNRADLKPLSVHFNHTVDYDPQYYQTTMGCPVAFGQERVAIEIPIDILSLPVNTRDPYLLDLLEKHAGALIAPQEQDDQFMALLQKLVVESLSQDSPTLSLMAKRLNISARTLHRRLASRGMNFKQYLQETKERLAYLYLKDASLSLSEIAFLLGYSEHSAFTRAFKQWHGVTPKAFRSQWQQGTGFTPD